MPLVSATRKAADAVAQLAQSVADARATSTPASATAAAAELLADAIRRGQSPELIAALKRALGLR